jgi:hypothetical protein
VKNFCYGLFRVRTASDQLEEISMTQSFRWLAAFALLVAFGAGAVRAEEEQVEVSPPPHTSVELLPAPHLVGTVVIPHAASCCQGCASCACSGKSCTDEMPADAPQYVVTTKIVYANADGDCAEIMSPKVMVLDGQTANVIFVGEQSPKESRSHSMQVRVASVEKGCRLNLRIEDSLDCHDAKGGEHTQIDSARMDCNVTLGKMKRLVLQKDADGSDRAWAEVTVTAIAPEDDAADSPLDCVSDAIGDLIDTVAEVATSLFGDDEVEPVASARPTVVAAAPLYLQAPPLDYGVPAEAPRPAVQQCVAVEAVKKSGVYIRIDDKNKRTTVEMRDGNKCWKASAEQISVVNGELVLEGDVRCESNGDAPVITADSIKVPLAGSEIRVGE